VEWKLVKATGTAQRNKANDCSETFWLPLIISYIGGIPPDVLLGWGFWWGGTFDFTNVLKN
jgi:hypothetical protein